MSSLNRQSNVQLKRKSSAQGSINSTFEHGRQAMVLVFILIKKLNF